MLGAIYIGLSGMDAYSKGLQIISNNVANLNTPGFKATSVLFSDMFSQGDSGGLTYLGSSFASESGQGVRVGNSLLDFGQGTLQQTDNDLDLAIQGDGFLVLQDNGQTVYTRTGSFAVGKDGYISEQGTGYKLCVLDESGNAVPLNVDSKRVSSPVATTKIEFSDNIASSDTTATVSNINVYDSRGGKHVWTLQLTKSTAPGATDEWDATVTDDTGAAVGTGSINFIGSVVDPASSTITISTAPQGADPLSVVLDFSSGVTSFSGTTTLRAASVDGYGEGDLTGVTVDEDGAIKLSYSNDQTASGGSVAIADFRDPQDLQQQSNGIFVNKGDGEIRYTKSGASGIGTLVSKQLESSNVDLSKEFGDLILVQRGFQACSQVVSVSNDMIQQLFGIRGQG